ncbi:hypothetical protein EVAR_3726_1 [Eumeta japonica]|uniref:Uncharacterized protein n=1 Tax=Eumeta variegata TaxID=151549 RepID=A0A4C1SUB3_EUMVA|nr:hypothetical protein EVAR_3726_1 [Eumeta japonica]
MVNPHWWFYSEPVERFLVSTTRGARIELHELLLEPNISYEFAQEGTNFIRSDLRPSTDNQTVNGQKNVSTFGKRFSFEKNKQESTYASYLEYVKIVVDFSFLTAIFLLKRCISPWEERLSNGDHEINITAGDILPDGLTAWRGSKAAVAYRRPRTARPVV